MNQIRKWRNALFLLLVASVAGSAASAQTPVPQAKPAQQPADTPEVAQAKIVLRQYEMLRNNFDPKLANLYAAKARVRLIYRYGDGKVDDVRPPAEKLSRFYEMILPLRKENYDLVDFKQVSYKQQDDGRVMISSMRYTGSKRTWAPFYLLVGPDKEGVWRIWYEYAETWDKMYAKKMAANAAAKPAQ